MMFREGNTYGAMMFTECNTYGAMIARVGPCAIGALFIQSLSCSFSSFPAITK